MDPFNIGPAMDSGAVKVGDAIAYGDGPRKKLDVYAPKTPGGRAPVLFFIYGGGWNHGDRSDYQFVGNAFASRGFVVVIADYRLYPDVKYPDFLEDNAAGAALGAGQHRHLWRRSGPAVSRRAFGRRLQCGDAGARPLVLPRQRRDDDGEGGRGDFRSL